MNSGEVMIEALNTDMRPVSVSTRLDRAMEHMYMCRWAKRRRCHSRMSREPSTLQNSLVVSAPTLGNNAK